MVESKENTLEGPKHRSPPRSPKTALALASSTGNEENEGLDLKEKDRRGTKSHKDLRPPPLKQQEERERKNDEGDSLSSFPREI